MATTPDLDIDGLLRTLAEAAPAIQRCAVRTLVRAGVVDERVLQALVDLLRTSDIPLREDVAGALAHIGRPALQLLQAALTSEDQDLRQAAIVTLALMGPPARDALPALRALQSDETLAPWPARAIAAIERHGLWQRRLYLSGYWLAAALPAMLISVLAAVMSYTAMANSEAAEALRAGALLGCFGAFLAVIIGRHVGGTQRTMLLLWSFALGGLAGGWLLSWILMALVAPARKVLGG